MTLRFDVEETLTPILVINLLRRPDRKLSLTHHLNGLALSGIFIPAVDGGIGFAVQPGTICTNTQAACWLSHVRAMKIFLTCYEADFCLILEDDAVLDEGIDWRKFLIEVQDEMRARSLDYLQIGHIDWRLPANRFARLRSAVGRAIPFRRPPFEKIEIEIADRKMLVRLGESLDGTHGYLISRRFAEIVQFQNQPQWTSADGYFTALARVANKKSDDGRRLLMGALHPPVVAQRSRLGGRDIDSDVG